MLQIAEFCSSLCKYSLWAGNEPERKERNFSEQKIDGRKIRNSRWEIQMIKKKKKTISLISTNGVANVFYYLSSILIVFNIIRKIKV